MFRIHLLFSLLLSLILFKYFNLNYIIFILVFAFSGILPDIDHSKSFIGRKFKILSLIINFIFGHRKLFHSLFFALIIAFIIKLFFNNYYIPFFFGYISHIILDGLTIQGVYPLYPLKFRLNWIVKTNGIIERLFLILLIIINIYTIIYIF